MSKKKNRQILETAQAAGYTPEEGGENSLLGAAIWSRSKRGRKAIAAAEATKATKAAEVAKQMDIKVRADTNAAIHRRLGLDAPSAGVTPGDTAPQTSVGGSLGDPNVASATEEERKRKLAEQAALAMSKPKTILGG